MLQDESIVIVIVKTQTTRFQFHEKFYREKFLPYKFRPHADLEEIARMAQQLDPNTDILSRFCICSCICISQDINSHNICLTLAIFGGDYKNGSKMLSQHLYPNTVPRSIFDGRKKEAMLTEKNPKKWSIRILTPFCVLTVCSNLTK